jgi:uncharacterized protein (TIGR02147 family)
MSVFEILDYRLWIKKTLKSYPKEGRGQLTKLAEALGCNNTLISQIMSGARDFSDEQAVEVAQFFGLLGLERDYFLLLVQFEKAGSTSLKNYLSERMSGIKEQALELKNRVQLDRTLTEQDRTRFYSHWMYSGLRMFCSVGDGKSVEEISERFHLKRVQAQDMLNFLVSTGLCVEKAGKYYLGSQSTFLEQSSPHYLKHLTNWRLKAVSAAESSQPEDFLITAPMSLSQKDFELIREQLMKTLKDVLARVKDSKEETVACLNIDFFRF